MPYITPHTTRAACVRMGVETIAALMALRTLGADVDTRPLSADMDRLSAHLWTLIEDNALSTDAAAAVLGVPSDLVAAYRARVGL